MNFPVKAYRYVSSKDWKVIQSSGKLSPTRNLCMHTVVDCEGPVSISSFYSTPEFLLLHPVVGLLNPKETIGALTLPLHAHQKHSFFLFEPEPKSWVESGELFRLLECIRQKSPTSEIVCLETQLNQEDSAFVHDWGTYIKSSINSDERDLPREYFTNRIPLADYAPEHFLLPEIVVRNSISLDRIKLHHAL